MNQKPSLTCEAIESAWCAEAEMGRTMPAPFVTFLALKCSETFRGWLEDQNPPREVLDLFEDVLLFREWEADVLAGRLSDVSARGLAENVGPAMARVLAMGGSFVADGSVIS